MKLAILKISDTCQLTVLKCNESLTRNAITVVYSLDTQNPLTECQALLSSMQVDELWVILQSSVITRQQTEHVICRNIGGAVSEKMSIFNNKDVEKIRYMAEHLGVYSLRIFDLLDIFGTMSLDLSIVLCSEYYDGRFAYIYAEDGDIKDFRVWRTSDVKQVRSLMSEYNTETSLSVYNNILDSVYGEIITNWSDIDKDERQILGLTLGAFNVEPIKVYALQDDTLYETSSRSLASGDAPLEQRVQEHEVYAGDNKKQLSVGKLNLPEINLPRFVNMDEDLDKSKSPVNMICNIVGISLSVILALSIIGNKQLPKDISYLTDKNTELSALVQPRQDTIDYYTKYSDVLAAKQPNIDEATFNSIKGIEVDGLLLAGVQIKKNILGLVVYLKEESQIDAYTKQLSNVITVTQVVKKGTVALNSTTLTKFVINGKR